MAEEFQIEMGVLNNYIQMPNFSCTYSVVWLMKSQVNAKNTEHCCIFEKK